MTGSVVPYAEAEAEFEKQTLEHALAASNGQISEAARMLRISRATFYKKLAKFGLASGSPPCLTFETARVRSLELLTPPYRHSPVAFARDPPQFQAFPRKTPDLAQGLL